MGLRRLRGVDQRADSRTTKRKWGGAVGYLERWMSGWGVRVFTLFSPFFFTRGDAWDCYTGWFNDNDGLRKTNSAPVLCFLRSPADVTKRLDRLVNDIRDRYHKETMGKPRDANANTPPCDVLLVAHGHILRAFAMRWIRRELTEGVALLLDGE